VTGRKTHNLLPTDHDLHIQEGKAHTRNDVFPCFTNLTRVPQRKVFQEFPFIANTCLGVTLRKKGHRAMFGCLDAVLIVLISIIID
jgi:hypothetical protein